MKGLIIKPHWGKLILDGHKTWEIRGCNSKHRGTIAIIFSGTKKIYGFVDLINVKEIDQKELYHSRFKHLIPLEHTLIPYRRLYAWELADPRWLPEPIAYEHPKGAVIWVDLPDDLTQNQL